MSERNVEVLSIHHFPSSIQVSLLSLWIIGGRERDGGHVFFEPQAHTGDR